MKKLKPRCLGCHGTRRMVSRSATASVVGITHHVGHPTATVLRGTDEGAECRTQEPRESTRAVTQPSVPEAYLVSGCSLVLVLGWWLVLVLGCRLVLGSLDRWDRWVGG
jgi:hypothetical protein